MEAVYSPASRRVIEFACEEARMMGLRSISSEHLFLGILREGGSQAARALASQGIRLDCARLWVRAALNLHQGRGIVNGRLTQDVSTAAALSRAWQAADQDGSPAVNTEHILCGLLSSQTGGSIQILVRHHIEPRKVLNQLDAYLEVLALTGLAN
jgi:ATP-dependent Clp protease ATP-binding subunit ClpC